MCKQGLGLLAEAKKKKQQCLNTRGRHSKNKDKEQKTIGQRVKERRTHKTWMVHIRVEQVIKRRRKELEK